MIGVSRPCIGFSRTAQISEIELNFRRNYATFSQSACNTYTTVTVETKRNGQK